MSHSFGLRHLTVAAFLLLAMAAPAFAAEPCAAPADTAGTVAALPHVKAALHPGSTLAVLTVGSATVFSPRESLLPGTVTGQALGLAGTRAAGDTPTLTDKAFPVQMARDIEALAPGTTVTVTVKGGRGMPASEMLDIIKTELAAHKYQMVIWQTGTVEAVRNVPAGTFFQTLSDGASAVNEAGADLVLVDPQFSRFLHANTDLDPYNQVLQQVAGQPNTILFHRFDLMRFWANDGSIDLERTPKGQRLKTVEALHTCLGAALARMVAASAGTPS